MKKVLTCTIEAFRSSWKGLKGMSISEPLMETDPGLIHATNLSDTVMLVVFEINTEKTSGLVSLCYPYSALTPVRDKLNPNTWFESKGKTDRRARLRQLSDMQVVLTAVMGSGAFSLQKISELQEGDTLVLATCPEDLVTVLIQDVPMFLARPSADGCAVEITQILEGGSYATG